MEKHISGGAAPLSAFFERQGIVFAWRRLVNGPVATVIFKLKQNGPPISSGMGTSGMVGPIGVVAGWFSPSEAAKAVGETAIIPSSFDWTGLLLIAIVIPAAVAWIVSEWMRKRGIIKDRDLWIEC